MATPKMSGRRGSVSKTPELGGRDVDKTPKRREETKTPSSGGGLDLLKVEREAREKEEELKKRMEAQVEEMKAEMEAEMQALREENEATMAQAREEAAAFATEEVTYP